MNFDTLLESDIIQNKNLWIIFAILVSGIIGYFIDKSETKQKNEEWKKFEEDMNIMFEESDKKIKKISKESEIEMKKIYNECNILEDLTENTIFYKLPYSTEISFIEPEDLTEQDNKTFFDDFETVSRTDFIKWLNS